VTLAIRHNPLDHRFEAIDGEVRAGLVEYIQTDAGLIVFTHTEVDPTYEGKGVGSQLARYVLDYSCAEGLSVLPICPFIAGYIQRHPEYQDLLYRAKPSQVSD
jgi:predicted GNAT family acetyltransferase